MNTADITVNGTTPLKKYLEAVEFEETRQTLRVENFQPIYRAPVLKYGARRGRASKVRSIFPGRVFFPEGYVDVSFGIEDGEISPKLSVHLAKDELSELCAEKLRQNQ